MPLAAIDAKTRLLAVLGDPIGHSLSPAMHNLALEWLAEAGIPLNYRYLAFHVSPERLATTVRGLAAMGCRGFNATIPHKEALLPLMDGLTLEASQVGAVNTVIIDDNGKLSGHNTDVGGFVAAAQQEFGQPPTAGVAILLGAGGAARAVLAALPRLGIKQIIVVNRHQERAQTLIEQLAPTLPAIALRSASWQEVPSLLPDCQWLVNTTSIGLQGDTPEMALVRQTLQRMPTTAKIIDIVYGARPTPLLEQAMALGLACSDGLPMLVYQGAEAFERWTGQTMPSQKILQHLRQRIQSR
ncbi:MAG: shikimate dehydrogenase [Magnetococcales bacterium]|nr:shikimate dehydrogenase [Magnetococcales bacterium]NGZ26083.1 shikimate dehydrogenase [Magnetococcales bacterium]